MEVRESTVRKVTLSGLDRLDPINLFMENFGKGQGRLIIECFGDCWGHYWGAMGEDRTLVDFILSAETEYLAGKLIRGPETETDYEKISKEAGIEDVGPEFLLAEEDKLEEAYGEDWRFVLPDKPTSEWVYLCRIIQQVKLGLACTELAA